MKKKKIRKEFWPLERDIKLVKAILSGSKIAESDFLRKALHFYLHEKQYVKDFPELTGEVEGGR